MIVQHYKNTCPVCGTSWGVDKNSRIRARQAELRERFIEQEHWEREIRIAKSVGSVCIIAGCGSVKIVKSPI